jgi:Sec23/Sec24 zinc finger
VAIVQPLATDPLPAADRSIPLAADIARCADCLGYINHLCAFTTSGWSCALCGTVNDYASYSNHKYIDAAHRATLPELNAAVVEAISPLTHPGAHPDAVRLLIFDNALA